MVCRYWDVTVNILYRALDFHVLYDARLQNRRAVVRVPLYRCYDVDQGEEFRS